MFTGIIEAVGRVQQVTESGGDLRLRIQTGALDLSDVQLGDSIATNGVCLTVVELPGDGFVADVSRESLAHTHIGQWCSGTRVNLEKALLPTTRLGGHLVSGHVDGVGTLLARSADARSIRLTIQTPAELARYIAAKGSITIDGISLTVNELTEQGFLLNIVPHTAAETTLANIQPGQQLHLEVDMIARYLEQLLGRTRPSDTNKLTPAYLAEHGFWK
ncbi:MAG: riboflavin synthase [Oceanobacter sp.]